MTYLYRILSIFLSFCGLASIIDSFYAWGHFFSDVVDLYRYWTTLIFLPLADFLEWVSIPFPDFARDVIVIWAAISGIGLPAARSIGRQTNAWKLGNTVSIHYFGFFVSPFVLAIVFPFLIALALLYALSVVFIHVGFGALLKGRRNLETRERAEILLLLSLSTMAFSFGPVIFALFLDWQILEH